jgi:hypothetical protein
MSQSQTTWWPHVARQGDTLRLLAYRAGVSADTIWSSPKNANLKALRKNGDILLPTDIIYLPPRQAPVAVPLQMGQTNTFVVTVPTMPLRVRFPAYRSTEYDGDVDGEEVTGTTDGSGGIALEVPIVTRKVGITFASGNVVILRVGHLDPINSESGVAQRLIHLGYPATTDDEGHSARRGVALFQHSQGLTPTGELDSSTQDALEKAHGL